MVGTLENSIFVFITLRSKHVLFLNTIHFARQNITKRCQKGLAKLGDPEETLTMLGKKGGEAPGGERGILWEDDGSSIRLRLTQSHVRTGVARFGGIWSAPEEMSW